MSFVSEVPEEQAGPELAPLYEQVRAAHGFIPHYFQALGRYPDAIAAQMQLGAAIMRPGVLSTEVKARIVLVVSGINSSSYCVAAHMEMLRKLGIEKVLGRKLATDFARATVPPAEQALYRYAAKLTRTPADISATDVEAVKQAGWPEAAVVETNLLAAWGNLINRVSLGLGLMAEY